MIDLCYCYNSVHHLPPSTTTTKQINHIFYTCIPMYVLVRTLTYTPQNQLSTEGSILGGLGSYAKEKEAIHCNFHSTHVPAMRGHQSNCRCSALTILGKVLLLKSALRLQTT